MDNKFSANDLISTKEAAEILDVAPRTLGYWRERKIFGIPFFTADEKHGDTFYYYRERIEQLKAVYYPGILMNMYRIAAIEDKRNERLNENTPSPDFQKPGTTGAINESPPLHSTRDLFTSEQASKYLGVPVRTLRDWNAKKKFQPLIIDHKGDFLYSREQLTKMKAFCPGGKTNGNELPVGQSFDDFFKDPENRVITKFNAQIYPSRTIYFPNDRLAKVLFNLTEEDFRDMNERKRTHNLVEIRNHKKFGKIISPYRLFADEQAEFNISETADQMDFAVLCICISEFKAGNFFTTPAIIYRGLTGKVDKSTDAMPSVNQFNAIMNSINKLMSLRVDITMKDYCENLGCNDGKSFQLVSNLLPCEYTTQTTINGQSSTIIHFLDHSPIWKIAQLKNQFLSFPIEFLNVHNQNNTPLNIEIKHYVLRRVIESIAHNKNMSPIITFDDVFKKCRLENTSQKKKSDTREIIYDLFNHLINCGAITSFKFNKEKIFFCSVSFTFPKE
ncbi:MAG: MerR family transcriptional regulator [Selenomonadaceae bacterium]|nr:MerR family transcriptional regulator [Selenomonadaceae bacterium]